MKYLIFLLLIVILVFVVFYYENKQVTLRRQLLVANSQNNNLRSKYSKVTKRKDSIQIRYMQPNNSLGITKEGTVLYSSPLEDSAILQKPSLKMEVRILDKAEVSKQAWYYIALPIDTNINSRGWVKQSDFALIYDNSKNVTKSF